ncbi:GIY-YIG nuclease family protein [Massilia sp. R2A-15]|uniref:GIY-YIG nuclease family protein n=1 Tax=Massilia sp. R2A-15 TaxID=3064278 RepID=UPI002733F8DD|nr:GIY-YIG nuclease family protein [Massilia sp. R2A-15]WLI89601.1 GIY-YIG nuclease family protein [Massilia sp. R2A-15]
MDLSVKWQAPINLLDGDGQNLIYVAEGLEDWHDLPGVYMFARIFDNQVCPLYIGKAEKLGARAWQHFRSNTRLMNGIKKAASGRRVLILGEFSPKPGQSTKKCIGLIEKALIDHALTEGHRLLNVQGTRTPAHRVSFSGYLGARHITGKSLSFRAKG